MRTVLSAWLLALLLLGLGFAQEGPPQEPAPVAMSFPGVAEVLPRASALAERLASAESRVLPLKETVAIRNQIAILQERQQELTQRIGELGSPQGWSFDRLQEMRGRLTEQRTALRKVLEGLSERLSELETLRRQWSDSAEFWRRWRAELDKSHMEIPRETFVKTEASVELLLKQIASTAAPLVELQQKVTGLQEKNREVLNRVVSTLETARKQIFKKTTHSLFSRDFYREFGTGLIARIKTGLAEVQPLDLEFWEEQGWVPALQLLVAVVLAWFILKHRKRVEQTEEWLFILHHPWATGLFVSVSALSAFYASPPALWRLVLWVLAAYSAAVLVAGLLRNPRKIFMVYLLSTLFILSLSLQIIALPQPLYRLYLTSLCLLGIPVLLWLARVNLRVREGKLDGFTMALRGGAGILAVALLSEVAGFSALASRVVEASVETVFLGLFVAMAVRLGHGGIDYLMGLDAVKGRQFIRRFGGELNMRLKGVFKVFVYSYAFLYLLATWGVYDSVAEAWSEITDLGMPLGETTISLRVVFLGGVVLYLSIVFSWVLRAILDTQVFPGRRFDRGIRDAIKKLLHYGIVLIGFLMAMSTAGFELRNFAVLAGALGIGIGFGLQNIVNNFLSGLILLFERPVKVDDMIMLGSEWGFVRKIGLRSTVVETLDRSEIIVPNSDLISEKVTNWTLTSKIARISLPVGVAYGSDIPLVLRILLEAAREHPDVLDDPPPSALFAGFGESSLDFELRTWMSDVTKRLVIRSELGQFIDRRFREEGVEIPFPQRDLHLRSVTPGIAGAQPGAESAVKPAPE